jgi:tetrahydromethanopterin S-methyltransferase subunit B
MGILNREVEEVELVPVARGIIARWWMVLIAALLGTAAMWLQESDLQTTPARNEVTRVYESRDETAMLSLVGIDPATISPFPSFDHQIIQIQEPAVRESIAASTGINAAVSITRSEQRFSLLDTVEGDGKTKFTFLSVGTPTYTFFCETESVDSCNTVLDTYVEQLQQLRQQSIVAGVERLQAMLSSLSITTTEHAEKLEALTALLSTTIVAEGPTISTVNSRTYIFGFLAGTIIGLLIALQLTLIDKRIRSVDQISRHVGPHNFIGSITEPSTRQHVAAAIVARAKQLGLSSIALAPASPEFSTNDLARELNLITQPLGVSVGMQDSILTVDAQTILGNQDGIVIVATKKQTTITQTVESWLVYESAQKQVLGLVLTD